MATLGQRYIGAQTFVQESNRLSCKGGDPVQWCYFFPFSFQSGNLVRIMNGENLSSTDVHLACNDTLMVGQVAEMSQVDPTDTLGGARVQNRKLQLWDIASGQPLEMAQSEMCTASCMMKDGERIVLGRTEKFGGGAWNR